MVKGLFYLQMEGRSSRQRSRWRKRRREKKEGEEEKKEKEEKEKEEGRGRRMREGGQLYREGGGRNISKYLLSKLTITLTHNHEKAYLNINT